MQDPLAQASQLGIQLLGSFLALQPLSLAGVARLACSSQCFASEVICSLINRFVICAHGQRQGNMHSGAARLGSITRQLAF
eukprot:1146608-Pelagomonas_calceolata.AAC.3